MVAYPKDRERTFTVDEYLLIERGSDSKSEFYCGRILAMAGASPAHNLITANVIAALAPKLTGSTFRVYASDLKIRTGASGLFAYPDATVVCGELEYHDDHRDVVTNPTLIVEVLSPSTEAFDRGTKFQEYQQIDSLNCYMMVAQHEPRVDVYIRQTGNQGLLTTATRLTDSVTLGSIGCALALSEVYSGVEFPERQLLVERGSR